MTSANLPSDPDMYLFVHSACLQNPGPAIFAYRVLNDHQEKQVAKTEKISDTTAMAAEYQAILAGLHACRTLTKGRVVCYSNNEVVMKQLIGDFEIRDKELQRLEGLISTEVWHFNKVQFIRGTKESPPMHVVMKMTSGAIKKARAALGETMLSCK